MPDASQKLLRWRRTEAGNSIGGADVPDTYPTTGDVNVPVYEPALENGRSASFNSTADR
jgi:hypothetical protein